MTYDTDAYWECYVRHVALTIYHPTGTCRMGPEEDNNSVVDLDLKVNLVKYYIIKLSLLYLPTNLLVSAVFKMNYIN